MDIKISKVYFGFIFAIVIVSLPHIKSLQIYIFCFVCNCAFGSFGMYPKIPPVASCSRGIYNSKANILFTGVRMSVQNILAGGIEQISRAVTIFAALRCGERASKGNQCVRKSAKARLPRARGKALCIVWRNSGAVVKAGKADISSVDSCT